MESTDLQQAKRNVINCVANGSITPEVAQKIFQDLVFIHTNDEISRLIEQYACSGYNNDSFSSRTPILEVRNGKIIYFNSVRILEWIRTAKHYEWTEEDEKFFNSIIWHVRNSVNNGKLQESGGRCEEWLHNLKEVLTKKANQD